MMVVGWKEQKAAKRRSKMRGKYNNKNATKKSKQQQAVEDRMHRRKVHCCVTESLLRSSCHGSRSYLENSILVLATLLLNCLSHSKFCHCPHSTCSIPVEMPDGFFCSLQMKNSNISSLLPSLYLDEDTAEVECAPVDANIHFVFRHSFLLLRFACRVSFNGKWRTKCCSSPAAGFVAAAHTHPHREHLLLLSLCSIPVRRSIVIST